MLEVMHESFVMYLMFMPPGDDSRYVPLRSISWSWWITAFYDSNTGTWSTPDAMRGQEALPSEETSKHPEWDDLAQKHLKWVVTP
jgi:hypothetical protein